jgi:hypothetical protein
MAVSTSTSVPGRRIAPTADVVDTFRESREAQGSGRKGSGRPGLGFPALFWLPTEYCSDFHTRHACRLRKRVLCHRSPMLGNGINDELKNTPLSSCAFFTSIGGSSPCMSRLGGSPAENGAPRRSWMTLSGIPTERCWCRPSFDSFGWQYKYRVSLEPSSSSLSVMVTAVFHSSCLETYKLALFDLSNLLRFNCTNMSHDVIDAW